MQQFDGCKSLYRFWSTLLRPQLWSWRELNWASFAPISSCCLMVLLYFLHMTWLVFCFGKPLWKLQNILHLFRFITISSRTNTNIFYQPIVILISSFLSYSNPSISRKWIFQKYTLIFKLFQHVSKSQYFFPIWILIALIC